MTRFAALAFVLALILALPLAGCGDDGDRQKSPLEGPPTWWTARERMRADTHAIHVQAAEPCEVSLVVEGLGFGTRALPFRTLAAGQSVRVWWSAEVLPATTDTPSASDTDAGRTEGQVGKLSYGYADSTSISNGEAFWAPGGQLRTAVADTLPPPEPEALPFDSEVELAAVALAEVASGEIQLKPSPDGHRLRRVPPGAAPERQLVLRLKLRVRHP